MTRLLSCPLNIHTATELEVLSSLFGRTCYFNIWKSKLQHFHHFSNATSWHSGKAVAAVLTALLVSRECQTELLWKLPDELQSGLPTYHQCGAYRKL